MVLMRSLLRQDHEIRMLEAVREARDKQVEEAKENLEGIHKAKALVEERRDFYRDIERLSQEERLYLEKTSSFLAKFWQKRKGYIRHGGVTL